MERLGLCQEKRGLVEGRQRGPQICWWVKKCKWPEGDVISEMTRSSFAHLIQACNMFGQKVRKWNLEFFKRQYQLKEEV